MTLIASYPVCMVTWCMTKCQTVPSGGVWLYTDDPPINHSIWGVQITYLFHYAHSLSPWTESRHAYNLLVSKITSTLFITWHFLSNYSFNTESNFTLFSLQFLLSIHSSVWHLCVWNNLQPKEFPWNYSSTNMCTCRHQTPTGGVLFTWSRCKSTIPT
jgi:hypothetical protein